MYNYTAMDLNSTDCRYNDSGMFSFSNSTYDNMTEHLNNSCLSQQSNICGTYGLYTHFITVHNHIVYIGTFLSLLIVVLNGILISILLHKNNITTINIMLSALGFCDACCAVLLFFPLFVGYAINYIPIDSHDATFVPGMANMPIPYPFCIIFDVTYIILSDFFHSMSMWITTVLGFIKAFVLMFPLQSRIYMTTRAAKYVCGVITFMCVVIYIPLTATKTFTKVGDDVCCMTNPLGVIYWETFEWIISVTYLVSFIILITSTIYIFSKLIFTRARIQMSSSSKMQERNRRAAIIVVIIVIIYLLSEAVSACCYFSTTFFNTYQWCVVSFYQVQQLIMLLGFASNFFIYWSMSRDLRAQVNACLNICFFCPKKSDELSTVHRSKSSDSSKM